MSSGRARVILVGGAGFIGSHFVDALLADELTRRVTVFDNFSSGRESHFRQHLDDGRFEWMIGDATKDVHWLANAMSDHDLVIHLASNPDIAAAATYPAIDFEHGTVITHHVLEAMRLSHVPRIIYASGSGVYGDLGYQEVAEDHGPLLPTSTYGASKLASEAMISAYAHMFGINSFVFRFGNVVGRRQTHGVGFDFLRRLREDPTRLVVQGDGTQSKSYILATDAVAAVLRAFDVGSIFPVNTFNVATDDSLTVRAIVRMALEVLGLDTDSQFVRVQYGNEPRGWKGDVPIVRLNTDRIRALGWRPTVGSFGALRDSMYSMLDDL